MTPASCGVFHSTSVSGGYLENPNLTRGLKQDESAEYQ
jgi:hypothetical protein